MFQLLGNALHGLFSETQEVRFGESVLCRNWHPASGMQGGEPALVLLTLLLCAYLKGTQITSLLTTTHHAGCRSALLTCSHCLLPSRTRSPESYHMKAVLKWNPVLRGTSVPFLGRSCSVSGRRCMCAESSPAGATD